MGNFGEDLRMERLSRGIALEEITAVTKISQRHLLALEQDHYRLLPGGILNKGIVRGYAGVVGLDQQDWTERFLKAYNASGQGMDDDPGWTAFASNVGKARILRHDAAEARLRWLGAILLLLVVAAAAFLTVRYFGLRAGRRPRHGVERRFNPFKAPLNANYSPFTQESLPRPPAAITIDGYTPGLCLPVQACLTDAGEWLIEERSLSLSMPAHPVQRSHRGRPPT